MDDEINSYEGPRGVKKFDRGKDDHLIFAVGERVWEEKRPSLSPRGRVVRAQDLKSGDPEFKSRSDHYLDLFELVPGSTPRLRLYIANWSASCQLGFLIC